MSKFARRQSALNVEQLDRRDVPASVSYPFNGVLTITGDRGDDHVQVNYYKTRFDPTSTAKIEVSTSWGDDFTFDTASVTKINFYGMAGGAVDGLARPLQPTRMAIMIGLERASARSAWSER